MEWIETIKCIFCFLIVFWLIYESFFICRNGYLSKQINYQQGPIGCNQVFRKGNWRDEFICPTTSDPFSSPARFGTLQREAFRENLVESTQLSSPRMNRAYQFAVVSTFCLSSSSIDFRTFSRSRTERRICVCRPFKKRVSSHMELVPIPDPPGSVSSTPLSTTPKRTQG